MSRERADRLLVSLGLCASRSRAQALIEAGKVLVDGEPVEKASEQLPLDCTPVVLPDHPYVSRGGLKLEGALEALSFDVNGLVVADVGASTGGFTDCVLSRGAVRVYAIDVGHGQLHARLRQDPRVVNMEGLNARHLDAHSLPEPVGLVVVDASFISLTKLMPALCALVGVGGHVLALVKPQFEVGRAQIGKRGVVRDDQARSDALSQVVAAATEHGLSTQGHIDCCIPGPEGNREIFVLLRRP